MAEHYEVEAVVRWVVKADNLEEAETRCSVKVGEAIRDGHADLSIKVSPKAARDELHYSVADMPVMDLTD